MYFRPITHLSTDDHEITQLLCMYDAEMLDNRIATLFDSIDPHIRFDDVMTVQRTDIFVSAYLNAIQAKAKLN